MESRGKRLIRLCAAKYEDCVYESANNTSHVSSPAPSLTPSLEELIPIIQETVNTEEHLDVNRIDCVNFPIPSCSKDDTPNRISNTELCDEYIPSSSSSETSYSSTENNKPASKNSTSVSGKNINEFEEGLSNLEVTKPKRGRKKTKEGEESRKRKREPKKWTREVRKMAKNSGQQYTTSSGKVIEAKQIQAPCKCKRKCYEKLNLMEREKLFKEYYKLSAEGQNQFLSSSVEETDKQIERLRRKDQKPSRRKFSRKYYFLQNNSARVEVCQTMFMNTLGLSLKKIRVIVEKRRTTESGICPEDQRGKHNKQVTISDGDKQIIKNHITMFPAYKSHYSRSHSDKKYLSPDLSITQMYRMYIDFCKENNVKPQKSSFYRNIFVECFNLSFKTPYNDSCSKCDKLEMKLKSAKNELESQVIQEEKDKHLNLAESAYEAKRCDKTLCLDNSEIVTISFDLQKCLATPFLTNSVSFYKRQLWTFNLTIYETKQNKNEAICYLWNETVAARGGQEISSGIYCYLNNLPEHVKTVNMYSDSCGGQNRNIYFAVMLTHFLSELKKKNRNMTINQKFLESGHTHMEADTVHASIEKHKKKRSSEIEIPRDWANLIRSIPRKSPIKVTELDQSDFHNFQSLLSNQYVHRKKNENGDPVQWLKIKWLQFSSENPEGDIRYKESFSSTEEFKVFNIKRRSVKENYYVLQPLHQNPIPISKEKLEDLKSLLPFISKPSQVYYQQFLSGLTPGENLEDTLPFQEGEEDD